MAATHLADVPTADPTVPSSEPAAARTPGTLATGIKVEVRCRLDDRWTRGFEILQASDAGYRLRRLSDDVEIPATFSFADVRKERKRDTWWY